ncbi:MAG: DUF2334 domain-containing protein [Gammaproteobacteria bacterium]|jgi:predicted deacetylase|nr:DUF2334 domain-containing protein [Gammaproteobacteria bacterium]MBT6043885.1 DUF2334 domain-containing protein [Gammaproteobacteria bacterium]
MHALISIHDVMPATLGRVQYFAEQLAHVDIENVPLLVVPGLAWSDQQIDILKELEKQGFILSGHGWHHTAKNIHGWYHRLHSTLISRNVAEHLSLGENEIQQLMDECYNWFLDRDLSPPDLYVPPAWAMGKISAHNLEASPFRYFENTAGFYDSTSRQQRNLPLSGFEADTLLRAGTLKFWNGMNKLIAHERRPVRISIHPFDHELLLSKSLFATLKSVTATVNYRALF